MVFPFPKVGEREILRGNERKLFAIILCILCCMRDCYVCNIVVLKEKFSLINGVFLIQIRKIKLL